MSQAQLAQFVLSGTDIAGLQRDPSGDHTGVVTLRYAADTGGPACTVLLNAFNLSGLKYHSLAEVDRGYRVAGAGGGIQVVTALAAFPSPAAPQRIVEDLRTSAKRCGGLHYSLNGNRLALDGITAVPLPTAGDDSAAVRASFAANGTAPQPAAVDVVRVGALALGIYVYGDAHPAGLLARAAQAATAELRRSEARWTR